MILNNSKNHLIVERFNKDFIIVSKFLYVFKVTLLYSLTSQKILDYFLKILLNYEYKKTKFINCCAAYLFQSS